MVPFDRPYMTYYYTQKHVP